MKLLASFVMMFVFSSVIKTIEAFWDDEDNLPDTTTKHVHKGNYRGLIVDHHFLYLYVQVQQPPPCQKLNHQQVNHQSMSMVDSR